MPFRQKIYVQMRAKEIVRGLVPSAFWKHLRERKIVRRHSAVSKICSRLIDDYYGESEHLSALPLKKLETEKIIWQYWAQGFENVPPIVRKCLASVDRYKGEYKIMRLTDENYSEYISFPNFLVDKLPLMSKAHFSDILRVSLLAVYGGVWMDATILLSGPVPKNYLDRDFFVFQRDPEEPDKLYWESTYAYYFGWAEGFRVNMLNSFIVAKKGYTLVETLAGLMIKWWVENDSLPDYFYFQILFDVLVKGRMKEYNCPAESDCLPHYLQQSINDSRFNLMERERIKEEIKVHKLTYKQPGI